MTIFKNKIFLLVLILVLIFAGGCGSKQTTPLQDNKAKQSEATSNKGGVSGSGQNLVFASGTVGGVWYPLGGAIAEIWQKNIPGLTIDVRPGGGLANVESVGMGKAGVTFTNASDSYDAMVGKEPFKQAFPDIKYMTNLYNHYLYFIVPADSKIKSIKDLKGKSICPGARGAGGELMVRRLLEINGMSYNDLAKVNYVGHADAVSLMQDGHLDAWLPLLALPNSAVMELATTKAIKFVPISDEEIKKMNEINKGYTKLVIPANTYKGVNEDVSAVGTICGMSINGKVSEDLAYQLTKTLVENRKSLGTVFDSLKELTPEQMAADAGIPWHPGALKYFKEIGVIK